VDDAIVFTPLPARRALQAVRKAFPDARLEIERRGPIRAPVRATLHAADEAVAIEVLTSRELSSELRVRRDPALDPLGALRLKDAAWARRIAEATGGVLRGGVPDPVLRGLALCALVGRAQAETGEWEGREEEPQRLLAWLERHGAANALSEEERAWLAAPVGGLPDRPGLVDDLASHAYALGAVDSSEERNLPALLHALGYLADEIPARRMRAGAERYLR